jgi:hypothetical protein
VLDQPVDEVDRGKGLAAAGCHLDHGAQLIDGEGMLQVGNGFDLRLL